MKKIFTLVVLAIILFSSNAVAQPNTDCNATFSYTISGNTVQFIPIASTDSSFIYHHWKFGDTSAVFFGYAPTHIYPGPGTYIVTQYVAKTGSTGSPTCSDSSIDTITITSCRVIAGFTWQIDSLKQSTIDFTNTTLFAPVANTLTGNGSSVWSFGDGSALDSSLSASHTYAKPGKYYVCLRMEGSPNCISYHCDSVTIPTSVVCNIQAYFNDLPDSVQANKIHFNDYTTNLLTSDSSYWNFGDSTTSRDLNPIHTFTQAGTYTVCLTVTRITTPGTVPCTSKFCRTVVISPLCNIKVAYTWQLDTRTQNTVDFTNTTALPISGTSVEWSFGDGAALDTAMNPIHTYAQPGTYYVCLRVQTNNTCINYQCDSIVVPAPACTIQPKFTWKLDSLNMNEVLFTNTTFSPSTLAVPATWFFGDDSSSTSWNTYHIYPKPGTYYVCLRLQPSASCIKYQCDSIVVPVPAVCNIQAYFNDLPDSLQVNKIHFNDYTTNLLTTDSSYWNFGDSTTSRDVNPIHTFTQAGTYTVCLTIIRVTTPGTAPCVSKFCRTVTIQPSCTVVPNYTWKLDSANGTTVIFTNTTLPVATNDSVNWFFGDGASATSWNATHTYAQAGKYYACLRIQTNAGCIKYQCDSITIPVPVVCNLIAGFTYQRDSLAVDVNTYQFTNASTPANGYDSSYWNFGDGSSPSYDKNPMHVFAQPGTYTVCLYIKNAITAATAATCESHICETVVVADICNIAPDYTWKIDSLNTNEVSFTNTTVPVSTAATVNWYFGDGTSATSWSASHVYAQPGKYYVCLRLQTAANCVKYKCDSITISAPAPDCNSLSLFTSVQSSTGNIDYYFAPVYQNTALQYTWTFGDGTGSEDIITNHLYSVPGNYTTCLTVYRDSNCASTTCKQIIAQPHINCDSLNLYYNYYKDGSAPNKIYFYTTLNYPILQQIWTITSLTNTADSPIVINRNNPFYVFNDTGYYKACLTAVTLGGCIKEYCNVIHITSVATPCKLQAYPNPTQTQVSVNVQLASPELIHAFVYNEETELILQTEQQGSTGTNIITINAANLTAGIYTIKLIYGNNNCFAEFQKL